MEELRELAKDAGFPLFGVIPAEASRDSRFLEWLDAGNAAGMTYLQKNAHAFRHPENVLPGVKSVVMVGMPYAEVGRRAESVLSGMPKFLRFSENGEVPPGFGRVAKYAWPVVDYHAVIRNSLKILMDGIQKRFPEAKSRGVVDSAPFHEREFARRAGFGWIGKNRMLTHPEFGNEFFIAAVMTSAEINAEIKMQNAEMVSCFDSCEKCLKICPTGALSVSGLDARRCLNYWMIEHRGAVPEEFWPAVGDRVFGCDACQTACPGSASASEKPLLLELAPLFSLTEAEFRENFRHTVFFRTGLDGMRRNAAIVLWNEGNNRRSE